MENNTKQLSDIQEKALEALSRVDNLGDLEAWHKEYLGKKSTVSELSKQMGSLSLEEKKIFGPELQKTRNALESAHKKSELDLQHARLQKTLQEDRFDTTKPSYPRKGVVHPLSQIQRKVEKIFESMGFEVVDGPEVDTEWHNFDALNIPGNHPARDMQDTFWIETGHSSPKGNSVLRTHTSPSGQIRALSERGAPMRVICPGRCFRNEATDMTHDAQFYQVEGMLIDKGITLAHLKGTIQTLLNALFEKDVKVRFRPGYFPFVEPGLEVDIWYEFTDKFGNERSMWMEFMGCGMTHPNVIKNCGVDPEIYSGFAFGFGLTRLVMLVYGLDDLRHLSSQKQDFLQQF